MKTLISIAILLTSIQSFGQFTKGDKVLSGNFTLNVQHAPESPNGGTIYKGRSFDFSPTFGFLVSENIEVGAQLGWSSSYWEQRPSSPSSMIYESKSNGISVGPYIRKYFAINDNFLFALNASVHYGGSKLVGITRDTDTGDATENESKSNYVSVGIGPNLIFFPSHNWALRAGIGGIGYNYYKNKTTDERSNSFSMNLGNIGFGLSYYFRQGAK